MSNMEKKPGFLDKKHMLMMYYLSRIFTDEDVKELTSKIVEEHKPLIAKETKPVEKTSVPQVKFRAMMEKLQKQEEPVAEEAETSVENSSKD